MLHRQSLPGQDYSTTEVAHTERVTQGIALPFFKEVQLCCLAKGHLCCTHRNISAGNVKYLITSAGEISMLDT